jgi:hypothetical protein
LPFLLNYFINNGVSFCGIEKQVLPVSNVAYYVSALIFISFASIPDILLLYEVSPLIIGKYFN